jgi:predicted nucleic acid-binding protein
MAGRTRQPVTRVSAFWDTSALVPLCVRQVITPRAIALYKSHGVVVWWSTPVEIASALARLVRMKQLDSGDWMTARKLAKNLADSWSVVQPSDSLCTHAAHLVERYGLRAADSLQLAAALEWCEDAPHGHVFLTADQKLREAALLTGFDVSLMAG